MRDLLWLVAGMSIAFAVLGSLWRHERQSLSRQRALLQQQRNRLEAAAAAEKARADAAESEIVSLERRGMKDVTFSPQAISTKMMPGDSANFTLRDDGKLQYRLVPKHEPGEITQ